MKTLINLINSKAKKGSYIMEIIEKDRKHLIEIKPLWEELNNYHGQLSTNFKEHFNSFTFEKRINKLINKENISVFIASDSGTYIGYCIVTAEKNRGEIDSIYIKTNYRGQRIGYKLMQKALERLNKLNLNEIDIYVAEGNEQVFSFYEKFGFKNRFTVLQKRNA
jgi:diamine N-acetyltransferase